MVLKINTRNAKKSDAAALSRCPAMFVFFIFNFIIIIFLYLSGEAQRLLFSLQI